jgi:D-alanine-D-alanine ligase
MHIAILTWWVSSEREVALRSGTNMNEWAQKAGHTSEVYIFPEELDTFLMKYKTYDLVIPVFHGIYGEDGQITAFLKTLNCAYAYSDFDIHALCINKYKTNLFLQENHINIPKTIFLRKDMDFSLQEIGFPAIVKPNHGWSSLWINRVTEHDELASACIEITDDDILIQDSIEWREFTVWVYRDDDGYSSLPIIEIKTIKQAFFDFEEKYESDWSNEVFLEWEDELQKILTEESIRICEYIWTKWVIRIDWRYDGKDFYFLEVNTIPGFTSGSLVPKMWKKAGKNEKEFIKMLATR